MAQTTSQVRFTLVEQAIPADPAARLALARQAFLDLRAAEADVARIERVLREGDFAARRQGLSRADQFNAWTRQTDAERLLVACLGAE